MIRIKVGQEVINNFIKCFIKDMLNQGRKVANLDSFNYFESFDHDKCTDMEADCHIMVNYSFY